MEQEVPPEVIKATQSSLGKYVKKPPLTEKLLRKPPFRFLHDIITSVLKSTGFFEGLFDENELVSDNVKDRDSKISFLNKVVAILVTTTGKPLSVKPSKIVAGQEPEKTNELLQRLAEALDKKLPSDDAVRKYKEISKSTSPSKGEKKVKEHKEQSKKVREDKKLASKSNEKLPQTKETSITRDDKIKPNINKAKVIKLGPKDISEKKESPPKTKATRKSSSKTEKSEKKFIKTDECIELPSGGGIRNVNNKVDGSGDSVTRSNYTDNDQSLQQDEDGKSISKDNAIDEVTLDVEVQLNTSYTIAPNDLNSSASTEDLIEPISKATNNKQQELARSSIPENKSPDNGDSIKAFVSLSNEKVSNKDLIGSTKEFKKSNSEDIPTVQSKNNVNDVVRPQSVRPSSSRPGAPRLRDKHESVLAVADNVILGKVNIIAENTANEEEEDSSIIIVDSKVEEVQADSLHLSSNQHGHLVQQILDSQNKFSPSGKTEIEWQFGIHKSREASSQEIEQLRFNIQALCRVANPLGKLLDHIQEDVEVMRQELEQWKQTYEETSKELSKQKIADSESLLPLHTKIRQLDMDIAEKHDKINDLKVVINKNATRIEKLLAAGYVH